MMTDQPQQKQPVFIPGLDIRRDRASGVYYVSMDTSQFIKGIDSNNLFIVWLLQRFTDEKIELSFKSGSDTYLYPDVFITIANAINICAAQVSIEVDHCLCGIESYIALAAKKLDVSDFGMIQLSPITARDNSVELPKPMEAAADYFFSVLDEAVSKGWVQPEERDRVRKGYWVNLTAFDLIPRLM